MNLTLNVQDALCEVFQLSNSDSSHIADWVCWISLFLIFTIKYISNSPGSWVKEIETIADNCRQSAPQVLLGSSEDLCSYSFRMLW